MTQKRPVHEIRLGTIRAAIWANEKRTHNIWFSVTISRFYRVGDEWKDTHSFGRDDLPIVAKIMDMPATRHSITHKFAVGEQEGYLTVGLFEDGRPGEVFLTMSKEGSTIGGLMDAIGILTSLALQYGVSIETLTRKLEYTRFEPSGWTHNENIRSASSIVDYVFRWLGISRRGAPARWVTPRNGLVEITPLFAAQLKAT